MKTLVIVSVAGEFLSLELSDFPTLGPVEGRIYEFDGKLYKASEVIESLGLHTALGTRLSGDQRLLRFADAVFGSDEKQKQAFLKPKKIGADGPADSLSQGGIIIPQSESKAGLSTTYDHLILVKTRPCESQAADLRFPARLGLSNEAANADAGEVDGNIVAEPAQLVAAGN